MGTKWGEGQLKNQNLQAKRKEKERMEKKENSYAEEICSLCRKKFKIRPFERNLICWGSKHSETPTMEKPSWICSKCKRELNSFMTQVLMNGKGWRITDGKNITM